MYLCMFVRTHPCEQKFEVIKARVHNRNHEGECLTASAAGTKSLHILEGIDDLWTDICY